MRKQVFMFVCAVLLTLLMSGTVFAGPETEVRTAARVDADTLASQAEVSPIAAKPVGQRSMEELRDSAALVLVGSMLIGLAAAVRRTA